MIELNNLTKKKISEEFIIGLVKKVLKGENKKGGNVSIALIGRGKMRSLNKKYRGKNRATDVLSFGDNLNGDNLKSKTPEGLGELVICPNEVNKNVKRYNSNFETELSRVLIHGVLHLLGYEHERGETGARKMQKKEEHYLSQIYISSE